MIGISKLDPVVGYTGFTPFVASNNVFSKDYQKCYHFSKNIARKKYTRNRRTQSTLPENFGKKENPVNEKTLDQDNKEKLNKSEMYTTQFHRVFTKEKYPKLSNYFKILNQKRYEEFYCWLYWLS